MPRAGCGRGDSFSQRRVVQTARGPCWQAPERHGHLPVHRHGGVHRAAQAAWPGPVRERVGRAGGGVARGGRGAWRSGGGYAGRFVVLRVPVGSGGVSAAIEAQRELASHEWPEQVRVRVRMGLHSGEPKAGDERYVGIGVHRAARIGAAAHGGQVLVSETARALVSDDLPAGVSLRDLGVHRLKDIDEPVRLYQVVAAGLEDRFPHRGQSAAAAVRRARLVWLVAALAVAGGYDGGRAPVHRFRFGEAGAAGRELDRRGRPEVGQGGR